MKLKFLTRSVILALTLLIPLSHALAQREGGGMAMGGGGGPGGRGFPSFDLADQQREPFKILGVQE